MKQPQQHEPLRFIAVGQGLKQKFAEQVPGDVSFMGDLAPHLHRRILAERCAQRHSNAINGRITNEKSRQDEE